MVHITLFEIDLNDASFEANAPFSGEESADGEDGEEAADGLGVDVGGTDEGGPSKLVPLVAGLVLLVALGALARKLRGGSEPEEFEDDAVDPVAVETS